MTDIAELIARLEAATRGSRELDEAIARAVYPGLERGMICGKEWAWLLHGQHVRVRIMNYTASLDAALTLVPERGEGGLLWRIILERKPLHSGPAWIAEVREHAKTGGGAIAHTAALAICAAALKARSAS